MKFISVLEFMKLAVEGKEPNYYYVIDLDNGLVCESDEKHEFSFDEIVGMMESSKCFVAYVEERP